MSPAANHRVREICHDAAGVIRRYGWTRTASSPAWGKSLNHAIYFVRGDHEDTFCYRHVFPLLGQMEGLMKEPNEEWEKVLNRWNDAPERTEEEVIALLDLIGGNDTRSWKQRLVEWLRGIKARANPACGCHHPAWV